MPGCKIAFRVGEDRVGEAERLDRGDDLRDLAFGMGPRISGIRRKFVRVHINNLKRAIGSGRCQLVFDTHGANNKGTQIRRQAAYRVLTGESLWTNYRLVLPLGGVFGSSSLELERGQHERAK